MLKVKVYVKSRLYIVQLIKLVLGLFYDYCIYSAYSDNL